MKRASGTPQDLADIDALEAIAAIDDTPADPWPGSFESSRREQLRAWRATTIAQRRRAVEEMQAFLLLARRTRR